MTVENSPTPIYSARLNGAPYQSGEPSGLGTKSITIETPDAEPFQTNLFTWYSGVDLGTINLARSKGTLIIDVAPVQNKVVVSGQHFKKQIPNCRSETLSVPIGEYEVLSEFEHFQSVKSVAVRRNASANVSIRPPVSSAIITAEPPDADFRFECQSGFPIVLSGKTPTTIDVLPTGKYQLTIWRGKFQKITTIDLTVGSTNRIHVPFDYAKLSFNSEPAGAEIRQGDEVLGQTPTVLTLVPGSYRVLLRREGFFPNETEFEVKGGEQREINVTLLNVAFVEAFHRAKSIFSGFNPDYPAALREVAKALEILPKDRNALQLQDDIQFAQALADAQGLAGRNDVEGALRIVNAALQKRPSDEHALSLKNELERTRRQRPAKAFSDFTRGIKHNELFDTQKLTVKSSPEKVVEAIHRSFAKDKLIWTKRDRSPVNGIYFFDADMKTLTSKQRAIFVVGQITDDTCEVYFKLWQYKLSGNIQILNGNMTEDSWSPVHPSFSSWNPDVVNRQRARDIEAIRQRFENELKTQ